LDGEANRLVGQTLEGRYRIEAVAGTGGFAVVYRALHVTLQRAVAVKVLRTDPTLGKEMRQRFEREARVLASLSHPNVVGVSDFGVAPAGDGVAGEGSDGQPYLVMELLEGRLLREVIDEGRLGLKRALGITRQVLEGLGHAHEHGVVHLDLKPTNILLQRDADGGDRVKILDFGFAKWFGNAARDDETPLTMMGHAYGTPGYMAPERMAGLPADARADLYAVGTILFEMIAGKRAYDGEGLQVMRAQLEEPIPRLPPLRPELRRTAAALDAVIHRAMAREPLERWGSATAMREALDKVPLPRRKRSVLPALGAVVLLAIAALVVGRWALRLRPELTGRPDTAAIPAIEEAAAAESSEGPAIGGRDPWADPLPPELEPFHRRLVAGERLRTSELGPLFSYVRTHPGDARPHLLFAWAYDRLGWREAVLQRYTRAHQEDPESRGDPRMLRDLLRLVTEQPVGGSAARVTATISDEQALPAIERVITALEPRPDAAVRVQWVRDRIARQE
jgi:serine/threonine-protein kinase